MGESFGSEQFERLVVVDIAILDHATVAVVGVLAHADVGDYQQLWHFFLNRFDCFLNDAGVGISVLTEGVFRLRNTEEDDRWDAELIDLFGLGHDMLNRLLIDAGHGDDLFFDAFAKSREHWVDHVFRAQKGLTDHAAHGVVAT